MPIVATWPNLIVIFELTMLGAILATVVALFVTARLPGRLPRFYDPKVTEGYILVGVDRPAAGLVDQIVSVFDTSEGGAKTVGT
jgi:hypothetical protein